MKTADSEACGLLPISAETLGFFWMPFSMQWAPQTKFHSLTLFFLGLEAEIYRYIYMHA